MKGFVSSTPPTAPPTTPNHHLLDTYRYLHPTQRETYTCWSTFLGYRYVYIVINVCIRRQTKECVHSDFYTLDLSFTPFHMVKVCSLKYSIIITANVGCLGGLYGTVPDSK